MMGRSTISTRHQRGFSLMELLLALGVFASVMIGVIALLQTYSERELARATNRYMMSVLEATRQILENPVNFTALYEAAMETGPGGNGGYMLYADAVDAGDNINIMHDFTVSYIDAAGPHTITIQRTRLLDANFTQNSPLRSQVRILLRIADNPANEDDVRALEIFVVTRTPRPDSIVMKAANEGGFNGGYIGQAASGTYAPGYANLNTAFMVSSFNGWRVPLAAASARLNGTNWYNGDLPVTLDTAAQGAFLVYYDYMNLADITSDYLYRIQDPDPSNRLNTMYGPLNLGGNDIIGADDVSIGDATADPFAADPFLDTADPFDMPHCVDSVLCVEGMGIVQGAASVGGNMTAHGSALVSDSANFANMTLHNGMPIDDGSPTSPRRVYGAQGLFVVDGDESGGTGSTTDSVTITGLSTFQDGMTVEAGDLGTINSTNVAMPVGGYIQAETLPIARRISAGTVHADSLTTRGQLKAGVVGGGDVEIDGRAGVIDISNMQNMQYGEFLPGFDNRKTLPVPRMRVEKLLVEQFGACGDCPQ